MIDNLTLVVGYIVVFKKMLTDIKVAAFDFTLGLNNGVGDHAMLDGFAMFHAHGTH